ncbi:hypothetical protein [Phreatobacter stygius]|uniref:WD40 repeat domain-containing protein n=1 Tax=Phreatobacter stygius TaxID=1940610 RepID=A0A4D7BGW7_9HYPH|nr:hypothetical protein [Phreatobacter stygius]QCI68406.1 hypothetical protein E8M01_31760 [Phreatobacter stygius]
MITDGRRRRSQVFLAAAIILAAFATAGRADSLASAQLVPAIAVPLPGYLQATADAAFGTPFTRVTQADAHLGAGLLCGKERCRHRYSSAQAWNADQSLLIIPIGCNGMCFLDGRSYAPLFRRWRSGECEWHPNNPEQMICVSRSTISIWEPRTNVDQLLYISNGYRELQFGPYKGNPSRDGRHIVIRAVAEGGGSVAFAYDLVARRKYPDIQLDRLPGRNNSCTISPLGIHVACFQHLLIGIDQAFIFTIDGRLVQSWIEHHRPGHGDMTVDADGSEVYVGISKSPPDLYQVIKRRLHDGAVTVLTAYGEAQHASIRSTRRPGWVFLTYGGDPANVARRPTWAPFAREVIAVRIDGSGEFRRVVQTASVPHDYWNEAQASPSPDGSQVIWASNWGVAGGPVFAFVARLQWPAETTTASQPVRDR